MPEFKVEFEQVVRDNSFIFAENEFEAEEKLLQQYTEEGLIDPTDIFVYKVEEVKNT